MPGWILIDINEIDNIIKKYENYPDNPVNNKSNLIYGESQVILDPGSETVRNFLIYTIKEFSNKYKNVDAIHFDGYF